MTTTYLVLDERERVRVVYEARAGAERRRRGSYACGGGGARRRRMVWGATCVRMRGNCFGKWALASSYLLFIIYYS